MKHSGTKRLCRAGVIAALYAVLTFPLSALAYGTLGFQIRPAEALTLLPLIFPEAIPALYVGCMFANLFSGFGAWDIGLGSVCSLIAAALTYLSGRWIHNRFWKYAVGGLFPVLVNAFGIPAVMLLAGTVEAGYWFNFASILLTQTVWVYALGIPLMLTIEKLRKKNVAALCDLSEHNNGCSQHRS